jgi:hypothetical protein
MQVWDRSLYTQWTLAYAKMVNINTYDVTRTSKRSSKMLTLMFNAQLIHFIVQTENSDKWQHIRFHLQIFPVFLFIKHKNCFVSIKGAYNHQKHFLANIWTIISKYANMDSLAVKYIFWVGRKLETLIVHAR